MKLLEPEAINCDVLIIGGGGAALRAAIEAEELGANVRIRVPVLDLVHERAGVPGFASDQLPGAEQAENAAARLIFAQAGAGPEVDGRIVDSESETRALL